MRDLQVFLLGKLCLSMIRKAVLSMEVFLRGTYHVIKLVDEMITMIECCIKHSTTAFLSSCSTCLISYISVFYKNAWK